MAKNKNTVVELVETTTEIETPYELPEGWKWCKLGNLCDLLNGFAFKSSDYVDESNVMNFRMSQIRPGGFTDLYHNTKYLPDSYADKYKDFLLNDGDVVIAMTDMANDAKILGVPTIVYTDGYKLLLNQRVGKLFNISKSIDSKFLNYMLVSPYIFNYYKSLGKGGLQLNISKPDILNANIPLPPTLEEQQRIVKRIETLFAKLDQAKEKALNVVDTFETRKASILHKAFTGELTKKWREENGVGDDSWEEKTIGECCQVKGGKRVPKGMSLIKTPNEHPYLKAGNLKNGTVIDKDMEYVPDDVLKFIKNYTVQTNDLYITNVGACIGDCGIIPEKYNGANFTENAVKLTELNCNNNYLAIQLSSNIVQQQILEKIKSATLGKLSIDNIKQLKVNIPSLPEQTEIVCILDILLEKEIKAKEAAEAVLEQIDLLKKSILARAFRGEL